MSLVLTPEVVTEMNAMFEKAAQQMVINQAIHDLGFMPEFTTVKVRHENMVREILRNQMVDEAFAEERQARSAERKFFWLFKVRSVMFRLAPRLAGRMLL